MMSEDVERIKKQLGEYEDLLTFEVVGENITIQLKAFLHGEEGKAKWEAINAQIKTLGGKWVGGIGKNSHWRVPLKREPRKVDNLRPLEVNIERLEENVRELKAKIRELREAGY